MTVTDKDHGYNALVKRIWGMGRPSIAVGILAGQGAEESHGEGLTTLQVAIWNEFGTVNMPARSFVRAWFDENVAQIRADLKSLMKLVVAGKMTKERALDLIAVRCVGQIQERMAAGIPPPNAPSTIAKKGGGKTTPLIDTGQLRAAVSSRVDPG